MKPINRRSVIEHALEVAELVNEYVYTSAIQKDDDLGAGLMASMADVLEEVKGAMASPDNASQESLRRLAVKASSLLEEYRRRMPGQGAKKDAGEIPPAEGDDQEQAEDEPQDSVEMRKDVEQFLDDLVRKRGKGKISEREFWLRLGYR